MITNSQFILSLIYRVLNEKQQSQNVALAADKIAATAAVNIADKNLPIHSKLFEGETILYLIFALPLTNYCLLLLVHRVKNMKLILQEVFHNELLFHCRAVEELSQLSSAVNDINDDSAEETE